MNGFRYGVAVIIIMLLISAASAEGPVINPPVTGKPLWCKFFLTKWICQEGTQGEKGEKGDPGPVGNATNVTNYYDAWMPNLTIMYSDVSNLYNTTVQGNLTLNASVINFYNITYSQMNQTANMTAGPQGIQGEKGDKGDTGEANMTAGPTGATGPQGDPGQAATVLVNHTFTGSPGSSASVVNVGDSLDARFDFTIPRGEAGPSNCSVYPIGTVYLTVMSLDNPNDTVGCGNWTRLT